MRKEDFNTVFRNYARTISPNEKERHFISVVYKSFVDLLGKERCFQIGSYPRLTAIRPMHDLDILYVIGGWDGSSSNPEATLQRLKQFIHDEYQSPTTFSIKVSTQTHSVTIQYYDNKHTSVFSVDIVPAYIYSKNEFGQDTYKVPEILHQKHGTQRRGFYQQLSDTQKQMQWIHSDPRGYIEISKQIKKQHGDDCRKAVQIAKKWKDGFKTINQDLKLKSFHIEQVITNYCRNKRQPTIFDAMFHFFTSLTKAIEQPQIQDRADKTRYIDEYVKDLTESQKQAIRQARDCLLIKLENFNGQSVDELIKPCFYKRSDSEQFLFDHKIPIHTESSRFTIDGWVKKKTGFRDGWISQVNNKIAKDRRIDFKITQHVGEDSSMWKVQNDKKSSQVIEKKQQRGEINREQTRYNPEQTVYTGNHYVECFAIKNGTCIARHRIYVKIP